MKKLRSEELELRKVFAKTLEELMDVNPAVVYLEADLAGAIGTSQLLKNRPQQAFDIGIMEANMIGVASGMSMKGKIPFVHSFGTFSSRRCADQTFLSGCYNDANVTIIGSDPGIAAEANGGTHMPLEDIAIYRSFPNMKIFDIAEPYELRHVMRQCVEQYGMKYIRFPRKSKKSIYDDEQHFEIGKGILLNEGSDVTIIASGLCIYDALSSAEILAENGIAAEVIDMFTIKPLDTELIIQSARKTRHVITVENHNIIGGLGSAVAETLAENCPVLLKRIGVRDVFGEVGTQEYLKDIFKMNCTSIVNSTIELLAKEA